MITVSIIGTGRMGKAIGGVLAAGGATVGYVGRGAPASEVNGEIVVLATPYAAVDELVAAYGPQLADKVVVDISNPLDFDTFDALVVPADGSAAAQIAARLPEAKVLKAFNTTFAATLVDKVVGPATTTVLVAGDDGDSKAALIELVRDGGLEALDAGKLKRARELEALGFLQLTLAAGEQIGWTGGFALVR